MKLMTNAIIRKSSFFLLGGMTAAAGWAVYAAGNIFENLNSSQPQGNNPVAIHATSPAQNTGGVATMPFATTSHLRRTANRSTSAPSVAGDRPAALPTATMNSTSLFAHGGVAAVGGTSSRTTARNGGYSGSAQVHSTVEDAKRAGTSAFGGNMLALASATMITAPGATNAGSVASMQVNTAVTPGPRKIGGLPGYNEDPVTDPPTPVGPTPFIFMALLAAVYGVFRYWRITTACRAKDRQQVK